jgi:hypothetical protein
LGRSALLVRCDLDVVKGVHELLVRFEDGKSCEHAHFTTPMVGRAIDFDATIDERAIQIQHGK